MNIAKRTFNPLLSKSFRYHQSEDSDLNYNGNWGAAIYPATISASEWILKEGNATISNESNTTTTTTARITGDVGENIIVNKVTLSDGQIEERKILLKIVANDIPKINNDYGFGW